MTLYLVQSRSLAIAEKADRTAYQTCWSCCTCTGTWNTGTGTGTGSLL